MSLKSVRRARLSLSRLNDAIALQIAKFSTSGPLMALLGLGIVYSFTPRRVFASPAYTVLFSVCPQWSWAVGCITLALIGFYGLYAPNRKCWLLAHGAALGAFLPMAFYFGVAGSMTGTTTYLALALNAGVRFWESYEEPDFGR